VDAALVPDRRLTVPATSNPFSSIYLTGAPLGSDQRDLTIAAVGQMIPAAVDLESTGSEERNCKP